MEFKTIRQTYVDPFTGATYRVSEDDKSRIILRLEAEVRAARQEMQQWEDETCLEIDELDSIIDGQQDYIKTIQSQLHNTLERKLQMSFELSAAQQEIAALKHSHSEVCEMNRRLCLDLEVAATQRHLLAEDKRQLFDAKVAAEKEAAQAQSDRDWCRGEIFRLEEDLHHTEIEWSKSMKDAVVARAQADNAIEDAIVCRRANDSLLDQLQAANAKLEAIGQILNPIPMPPEQGQPAQPRPMWSRYRRE
jgi:chromosome segregation ATPase